jgi:hypothetical protein
MYAQFPRRFRQVLPWHFVQVSEGTPYARRPFSDGSRTRFQVQVHRYFPARNNHGDHEAVLLSDSPKDTNLAPYAKPVEHSAQCGDLVATSQKLDADGNR